jgi:hypothetical protein
MQDIINLDLKYWKPDINLVSPELVQADKRALHSEIHKIIIFNWIKKELPQEWKLSLSLLIEYDTKQSAVISE